MLDQFLLISLCRQWHTEVINLQYRAGQFQHCKTNIIGSMEIDQRPKKPWQSINLEIHKPLSSCELWDSSLDTRSKAPLFPCKNMTNQKWFSIEVFGSAHHRGLPLQWCAGHWILICSFSQGSPCQSAWATRRRCWWTLYQWRWVAWSPTSLGSFVDHSNADLRIIVELLPGNGHVYVDFGDDLVKGVRSARCAVRTWSGLVLHTIWVRFNSTAIVKTVCS